MTILQQARIVPRKFDDIYIKHFITSLVQLYTTLKLKLLFELFNIILYDSHTVEIWINMV